MFATGLVHVVDLRFRAVGPGVFRLFGEVVTLTSRDDTVVVVEPASFVAGEVAGEIVSSRNRDRKAVIGALPSRPMQRRATSSKTADAGACSDFPPGDANGDCIVDVRDAAYLFESLGDCPEERWTDCDPDGNGVIDGADALYQLGYVLGRYPLVRTLDITPASELSNCLFTLKNCLSAF